MVENKDFLTEIIAERTARNPEFPGAFAYDNTLTLVGPRRLRDCQSGLDSPPSA